jgi:hypothetical protein
VPQARVRACREIPLLRYFTGVGCAPLKHAVAFRCRLQRFRQYFSRSFRTAGGEHRRQQATATGSRRGGYSIWSEFQRVIPRLACPEQRRRDRGIPVFVRSRDHIMHSSAIARAPERRLDAPSCFDLPMRVSAAHAHGHHRDHPTPLPPQRAPDISYH